jgi:hypothetical protein
MRPLSPRNAGDCGAGRLATLGLAAASRLLAVGQMTGMDMGDVTRPGSFASFLPGR